jgi:predicted DNA-binding transcriptional regulator YafY
MRADRLLSLLLTLQTEGKVKAKELARRQGVSPRTIYRDLDALTAAGVPVYAEPGPTGGVALMDGYRTQLTGLSEAELQTLFFGKPPALLQDLGLANVADAALLKVLASLPAPSRVGASSARQHLYIDTTGWARSRDAVPLLPQLYEAVQQERRVTLHYARPDKRGESVTRLVDPLGLVARGSTWYLIAAVEGELRTYRVSRVQGLELMGEPCLRPDGFDLATYWEASKAAFREQLPRYPVTVRAKPDIADRMRVSERYARVVTEAQTADEDGWLRLGLLFEVDWEACEYLLSFGPAVEVVEPPELRGQIAHLAQQTTQLYARHERHT